MESIEQRVKKIVAEQLGVIIDKGHGVYHSTLGSGINAWCH